jgi:hypothetical protein
MVLGLISVKFIYGHLGVNVLGLDNGFFAFMQGVVKNLNAAEPGDSELHINPTGLQAWIRSIHFYPY